MRQPKPVRGPQQRRSTDQMPVNHRLPAIYRLSTNREEKGSHDPSARDARMARLEAALFLANEPLPARKLASAAGLTDTTEARKLLKQLREFYDRDGTAFQIIEIAGGFQLATRAAYRPWLVRAQRIGPELVLTPAAMETLSVVAYRQPITRADVESVRGVNCSELLTQLMERGLIKIVGRHESLGRPVLYGTTKNFLQFFGLNSLRDLPSAKE